MYCQCNHLNGYKHNHTWKPAGSVSTPFSGSRPKSSQADLRLCSSPSDFTFPLIVWRNIYLSVNIFHFRCLIIWNIWLTVTKSTVWVTNGYLAIRFSYLSLIPPSFFSVPAIVGLAINIYDREMICEGLASWFMVKREENYKQTIVNNIFPLIGIWIWT